MKKIYEGPRMVVARFDVAEQLTVSKTRDLCYSDDCEFWNNDSSWS